MTAVGQPRHFMGPVAGTGDRPWNFDIRHNSARQRHAVLTRVSHKHDRVSPPGNERGLFVYIGKWCASHSGADLNIEMGQVGMRITLDYRKYLSLRARASSGFLDGFSG